jgi:hypothetical protein
VLSVKEVAANGVSDGVRNCLGEKKGLPIEKGKERGRESDVDEKSEQTIPMLFWFIEKGINAHAVEEDEKVAEENREWMAREEVLETRASRGFKKLRFGHDGKGADVGAFQPGIMVVMMIVRASPDAGRAQTINPKNPHQGLSEAGFRKDGVMLLIVVNDKKPEDKQAGQDAAGEPGREMQVRQGSCYRQQEKKGGGRQIPPAFQGRIAGVRLCR